MAYVSFGWSGEPERDIKLFVKDGVWMTSHYIEGKPDELFVKIFGSHELTTPWTEETDRETVVKELSARNPHAKVS